MGARLCPYFCIGKGDRQTLCGGAIANSENLTISQSKIVNNKNTSQESTDGGGITVLGGNITLKKSLVTGNEAFTGDGGGIFNQGGSLDLDFNSVFANTPNDIIEV